MISRDHAARIKRSIAKRVQYVLMRHVFPLSKSEMVAQKRGHRIFANSIPKSGTNLLTRLLNTLPTVNSRWTYHIDETMPGLIRQLRATRKGQVVSAHLAWHRDLDNFLREHKFRKFLIVRDLRDVAVSGCFYVTYMDKSHPLHPYFLSLRDDSERLLHYIRGVEDRAFPGGQRPRNWVENFTVGFIPWVKDPECLLLRFEDLIGSLGGGEQKSQQMAVVRVLKHLNLQLNKEEIEDVCSRVFSTKAKTFRKGKIGGWKTHFSNEHKAAFKERNGQILIELGYESNNDW